MRAVICALLLAIGIAEAKAQTVLDGSETRVTEAEFEALKQALPGFLKDPKSVQFSKLHKDPYNALYICGMFNAKNAYGGYTGTQPFRFGLTHGMLITGMNSMGC